jgi:hypothetical protein
MRTNHHTPSAEADLADRIGKKRAARRRMVAARRNAQLQENLGARRRTDALEGTSAVAVLGFFRRIISFIVRIIRKILRLDV